MTEDDLDLAKIVDRIILGPTLSNPLAKISITKMVEKIRPELKAGIFASAIPFRSV